MSTDPDDALMASAHVRALQAPASAAELGGEERVLAAFRSAVPVRGRGRHGLRLATGASALVVAMAVTAGAAAAYTDVLPRPLQDAAHRVLGPVGVPAPHKPGSHPQAAGPRHLAASPSPSRQHAPVVVPTTRPGSPAAAPRPSTPAVARPTATPTPSPSPSVAPQLSASVSRRVVPIHQGVQLRGVLSRNGNPAADVPVRAVVRAAGDASWRQVAAGRTAADGSIQLHVAGLVQDVRLRLEARGVVSPAIGVVVVPALTVDVAASGTRYAVTVSADGGRPGDQVVLFRYDGTRWVRVSSHQLGSQDRTRFLVPRPSADPVQYRVRLAATDVHGPAGASFTAQP